MKRNFKKFLTSFMACALALTMAPVAGAETPVPAGGTIEGDSEIVYENTEIYSVIVPTSFDLTIDPQGLTTYLKASSGAAYNAADAGKVFSSWVGVKNTSSKPIAIGLEAYVDAGDNTDKLQLMTEREVDVIESTGTATAAAMSLNLVSFNGASSATPGGFVSITASPGAAVVSGSGVVVTGTAITVTGSGLTFATPSGIVVTGTSLETANKIGYQLEKASYRYFRANDTGFNAGLDKDGNGIIYVYDTDRDDGDVAAFSFVGKVNKNGDWSAFTENGISVKVKYHFDKINKLSDGSNDSVVSKKSGNGYREIEFYDAGSQSASGGDVLTSDGTTPIVFTYPADAVLNSSSELILRPVATTGTDKSDFFIAQNTYWTYNPSTRQITLKTDLTALLHRSALRGPGTYVIKGGGGKISQNITIS